MKIWEAIQMLEQMDQTKEVTVTFGTKSDTKPFPSHPFFKEAPQQPYWVKDNTTSDKYVVTCRGETIQ